MRVFLDTNILLDIIEQRMPHYTASLAVLERGDDLNFELFVAWHGLATVFYITARKQGEAEATNMIRNLLTCATVSTVGHDEVKQALGYGITDYEDALQAAAANACAPHGLSLAMPLDSPEVRCRSSALTISCADLQHPQARKNDLEEKSKGH